MIAAPPIVCDSPCVISYSLGGVSRDFEAQAQDLRRAHTPIIVDGPCISACTILVDDARELVCITPRAWFGYHMGTKNYGMQPVGVPLRPASDYVPHSYSTPGLNAWIKREGGLPKETLLRLDFDQAKAFYRVCP